MLRILILVYLKLKKFVPNVFKLKLFILEMFALVIFVLQKLIFGIFILCKDLMTIALLLLSPYKYICNHLTFKNEAIRQLLVFINGYNIIEIQFYQ